MSISRRTLLKRGAVATATLPFISMRHFTDTWREEESNLCRTGITDKPYVRLSHNENPYGPSQKAREAAIKALDLGNRYPRNAISDLKDAIAAKEKVSPDQILISAGSTELLGVVGIMSGMHKGRVISSMPTFDFMCRFAEQFSAEWVQVPLTDDHQYNLEGINAEMNDNTKLVFVCNPNNPTGAELPSAELHPFCLELSRRCLVYVDEAYIELSKEGMNASMANMTRNNKNLVIGRTFSKVYGLAGMRVGYAIGHTQTIEKIRQHLQGRGVTPSVCSVAAAQASLDDTGFVEKYRQMNDEGKQMVYDRFSEWGVEYIETSTNFIFFKTERFADANVRGSLQRENVMIRNYSHTPGWARVSIGTPKEMDVFLDTTKKLLT